MKCVMKNAAGIFFPNNIFLSNYHFTHREKPIIRPYDCWVVLCTVKNLIRYVLWLRVVEINRVPS
jgi:hypothetical protein